MSHIDIFTTYRALDNSLDRTVTKDDLNIAISGLEKDLKFFYGKLLVGTMFLTYLIPIALAITLKLLHLV